MASLLFCPRWSLPDGTDPIRRQSVLGLGLSFRPQARIDLGASVQMGLGGLAPSAVLVRVLVLSAGKTYQGRAATPAAQLAADVAVETVKYIHEYIQSLPVDPKLDESACSWTTTARSCSISRSACRLPTRSTASMRGEKLRIGEEWERDKAVGRLLRQEAARLPDVPATGWQDVSRPAPTVGGRRLRAARERLRSRSVETWSPARPIAQSSWRSSARRQSDRRAAPIRRDTSMRSARATTVSTAICGSRDAPRIEEQVDRCFMALGELPQKMQNQSDADGRSRGRWNHGPATKRSRLKQPRIGWWIRKIPADGRSHPKTRES